MGTTDRAGPDHSGPTRSAPHEGRAAEPPAGGRLLALQRAVGNRALSAALDGLPPATDGRVADHGLRRLVDRIGNGPSPDGATVRRSTKIALIAAAGPSGGRLDADVSRAVESPSDSGEPLADGIRSKMEAAFGRDFSAVRIHRNSETAPRIAATAFTHGSDVHFAPGQFAPGRPDGRRLLAHELTHVVQQSRAPRLDPDRFPEVERSRGRPEGLVSRDLADEVSADRSDVVRRHGSAEHMLLGDTDPRELARAADESVSTENRVHVLHQELRRLKDWYSRGAAAIAESDGDQYGVRMINVGGTGAFWVTNGEMNALPDYVPNPEALIGGEAVDDSIIQGFIQHIRFDSIRWIREQVERIIGEEQAQIQPVDWIAADPGGMAPPIPVYTPADQHRLDALEQLLAEEPALAPTDDLDIWTQRARNLGGTAAAVAETRGLSELTSSLGPDEYTNLLGRNACHFVPFSWDRWYEFHGRACELAARAHRAGQDGDPEGRADLLNQARVNNGYADHFLQDSFAAGHLINKTLIMQWYVEWMKTDPEFAAARAHIEEQSRDAAEWRAAATEQATWGQDLDRAANEAETQGQQAWEESSGWGAIGGAAEWLWGQASGAVLGLGADIAAGAGTVASTVSGGAAWANEQHARMSSLPADWERIRDMDPASQPGLSARHAYAGPTRERGAGESSDPQTAEEQATREERMATAGVQGGPEAYQNYLTFLEKGAVQVVTNDLHNHYCVNGLTVVNGRGDQFMVYGDYHLLDAGAGPGVELAGTAAHLSQEAVERTAEEGAAPAEAQPDRIFELFPQRVMLPPGQGEGVVSIEQWHFGEADEGGPLKQWTIDNIFRPKVQTLFNNVGPLLDMSQISQDVAPDEASDGPPF